MAIKNVLSTILLLTIFVGISAQGNSVSVKVIDTKDVTTVVNRFSSSSSSSCNSSDFPVYQGTVKTDVDFSDLKMVVVRHDKPAEDANNYITVELIFKSGSSGLYEVVKHIRFTGKAASGDFSIKVNDVNTVEILD